MDADAKLIRHRSGCPLPNWDAGRRFEASEAQLRSLPASPPRRSQPKDPTGDLTRHFVRQPFVEVRFLHLTARLQHQSPGWDHLVVSGFTRVRTLKNGGTANTTTDFIQVSGPTRRSMQLCIQYIIIYIYIVSLSAYCLQY